MKEQVIFYGMYGHVYRLADAVAAPAREVGEAEASLLHLPELVPDEALERSGAKAARHVFAHVPTAVPDQMAEPDAIIVASNSIRQSDIGGGSPVWRVLLPQQTAAACLVTTN